MKYAEYLQSDHWKQLREQKFKEVGASCSLCRCTSRIQVHHINYRYPWTDCTTADLQVMCEWCHAKHHRKGLPSQQKPKQFRSKKRKPWKKAKPFTAKELKTRAKYLPAWERYASNARR